MKNKLIRIYWKKNVKKEYFNKYLFMKLKKKLLNNKIFLENIFFFFFEN